MPRYSNQLDFELEFGIYIGKQGKDIPVEKAGEYIAGYTIFNDISARDQQAKEMVMTFGPSKGKDFDDSKVFGPRLVTPDEFGTRPHKMTACINGEVWGESEHRRDVLQLRADDRLCVAVRNAAPGRLPRLRHLPGGVRDRGGPVPQSRRPDRAGGGGHRAAAQPGDPQGGLRMAEEEQQQKSQKIAIVTGGAMGIGESTVRRLVAKGHKVLDRRHLRGKGAGAGQGTGRGGSLRGM